METEKQMNWSLSNKINNSDKEEEIIDFMAKLLFGKSFKEIEEDPNLISTVIDKLTNHAYRNDSD